MKYDYYTHTIYNHTTSTVYRFEKGKTSSGYYVDRHHPTFTFGGCGIECPRNWRLISEKIVRKDYPTAFPPRPARPKQEYFVNPDFPKLTWRRLKTGEIIRKGDMINSKDNPLYSGWVKVWLGIGEVITPSLYYYRRVHCKFVPKTV